MSTKTNLKRIALVAVAALGLGVLSSVPSNAATSGLTVTVTNGTSAASGQSDSRNAATINIQALLGANDTMSVYVVEKSRPAGTVLPVFYNLDSSTPTMGSGYVVETGVAYGSGGAAALAAVSNGTFVLSGKAVPNGTITKDTVSATAGARFFATGDVNMNHTLGLQLDSITSTGRTTGTYIYTVVVKTYETIPNVAGVATTTTTKDVSIVIAATASASTTIAPASTTAFLGTSANPKSDSVIAVVATASATPVGYIEVTTKNANGDTKPESITATISGAGLLKFGSVSGASLTIAGDGSSDIEVLADGRAGVATITLSTTSRANFSTKQLTFFALAPATLVASVATPLLATGSNSDVVRVTAKDSNGVSWAGQLYIYASAATDAAIAGAVRATAASSALTCTWDAADDRHECPVTGVTAGTAKMKVTNYATAALATAAASGAEVTSNEVSVVVSQATAATVKIEFDKATYAPGERARIYVTPLDSTGKAMQVTTHANLFATGGITTASALTFAGTTTTADSLTAVSITTKNNSSSTSGARAGSMEYTVYMPVSGGTVTISATGGTSLPIAGRVAVTASATVTDSGAAALAAVNALATSVASLRTLITTLTNLVLKIQKKVKA